MASKKKYRLAHPKVIPDKEETVWVQCGMAYEDDKGRISILMTAIPIGFDGKLWLFPEEGEGEGDKPKPKSKQKPPEKQVSETGWTRPEGYESKVHMRASDDMKAFLTWCDHRAKAANLTLDWDKVTCKKCLKEKPEEEPEALGEYEHP